MCVLLEFAETLGIPHASKLSHKQQMLKSGMLENGIWSSATMLWLRESNMVGIHVSCLRLPAMKACRLHAT